MKTLTAGEIVDLVTRGQMRPTERFTLGPPTLQRMNADDTLKEGDDDDDDRVLVSQGKTCCTMCSARFILTTDAVERVSPQCCCCCDTTSHYNLSQVQNVQLSECCGWCCSKLRIHLDNDEHLDLSRMPVDRLRAFHHAIKPRISRFRVGKR